MKTYAKSYLTFLAFVAITAIVVRPMVSKLGVPLATKAVGG